MRHRFRITRNDILLLLASGSSLKKTIFTVVCLITLLGSSFRPMPGPSFAVGSMDSSAADFSAEAPDGETEDQGVYYTVYQVKKGDTISDIAEQYDISIDTIFSANGIQSARGLRPGQYLKIPSVSGIVYKAKEGDTTQSISARYSISEDRLILSNGLLSEKITPDEMLFLPDAKLPAAMVKEISGDLFKWPARGVITSWYSWRRDPFSGRNSFHNGIDIGVPLGTPVAAAMEGTVAETGYSSIMGKYVTMRHPGGWKTLYAHMSSVSVQSGQYVSQGKRLGLSGNTGYSTGPHLHFTVYKNSKMMNPANVLQ